jgi:hypothetical protein
MEADMSGSEWDIKPVIERLRSEARVSGSAAAQVFLQSDAAGTNLTETVQGLIDTAKAKAGLRKASATIGMISPLSKSFSLTAAPEIFETLAQSPSVKTILPAAIEDIFPKPTKIVLPS